MRTPWGPSQHVVNVAEGIRFVETASHGGYLLDADRNARIPLAWRAISWNGNGHRGWYEEDCDWALVALTFPAAFPPDAADAARKTFAHFHAPKLGG